MSKVGGSDRYSSNNGEVGVRVAKTGSQGGQQSRTQAKNPRPPAICNRLA